MDFKHFIYSLAFILVIIGALVWGTIGVFDYNIVSDLVGDKNAKYVYDIVGVSALVLITFKIIHLTKKSKKYYSK